jgi:hypothetical protein
MALVALGCGHSALPNLGARPEEAVSAAERPAPKPRGAVPRLGPFAGAGSGVRRVDVAQR